MNEKISILITTNSLYNKSIENNISIDPTTFDQLEDLIRNKEIDDLASLLLFLLEHVPFEIDLNLMRLIENDSRKNLYKPNLFSYNQYPNESKKILNQLFQLYQINNLQEFLLLKQNSQFIYLRCLHLITPLLSKTNYDKHPIAIQLFVQIIKSLSQTSLAEIIDQIFPICLITLDDPTIDMKLISLYLLDHLQKNSTTTDLLLFNRANVIMYGLEQNLYRRGDRIIFFECLLSITYRWLLIIENDIYSGKHLFIRTSQFIERFIRDCLLEINIEYRCLLLKILRYYLNRLQLFSCRHLKKFIELIDDSIDNHLLRYDSLQLLLVTIQLLKPRINVHRYDIMKIIIRCLFKILHEDKEKIKILNLLKQCLKELKLSTDDNYVSDALKSLINTSQLDISYREYLQKFLDNIEEN